MMTAGSASECTPGFPLRWVKVAFMTGCLAVMGFSLVEAGGFAVLPFRDQSHFKGPWAIGTEFPKALSTFLSKRIAVISFETVERKTRENRWRPSQFSELKNLKSVAEKLGADFLITGKIEEFHLIKKGAGYGVRGGYKHYTSTLGLKVKIYDASTDLWKEIFKSTASHSDEGLRLNLPGKISKDEEAFHKLEETEFGSDAFMQSVAGKAVTEVCEDILDHLQMAPRDTTQETVTTPRKVFEGRIITIVDTLAYINLGFDDTISAGERFPVFADGECLLDPVSGDTLGFSDKEVGSLEISLIKARHLSIAIMIKGRSKMEIGNRVRVTRY